MRVVNRFAVAATAVSFSLALAIPAEALNNNDVLTGTIAGSASISSSACTDIDGTLTLSDAVDALAATMEDSSGNDAGSLSLDDGAPAGQSAVTDLVTFCPSTDDVTSFHVGTDALWTIDRSNESTIDFRTGSAKISGQITVKYASRAKIAKTKRKGKGKSAKAVTISGVATSFGCGASSCGWRGSSRRAVVLQVRTKAGWKDVARTHTTTKGTFAFHRKLAKKRYVRVIAAETSMQWSANSSSARV